MLHDPQGEPSDLIRSVARALKVLESTGSSPRGLTVKQIARRCGLTVATTYHLVRTLAYEGYVVRREDGTYIPGLAISDRYRELSAALRGPSAVSDVLRKVTFDTGYSHYLGSFVGGVVTLTAVAEGPKSPYLEDLIPGFDDGAHATALGKALLVTLSAEERMHYLKDYGMRSFTGATITEPAELESELALGDRRGIHIEIGQYRPGLACAAVPVIVEENLEKRVVLACAMPSGDLVAGANFMRSRLAMAARAIADLYTNGSAG